MSLANTSRSYGSVARVLHWLTALLILTAIPLGLIANAMPFDTGEALAAKAQLFSVHKTVGVAAFLVALARILWALTQPRPAAIHPDRKLETLAAEVVHWTLYLSLLLVPLSGWIEHAATDGFAPILWPLGQNLPLVPKSPEFAHAMALTHWVFTKVLIASVLLHIAGALKHAVIDRDGTVARMIAGRPAPAGPVHGSHALLPAVVAVAIYAVGVGVAIALIPPAHEAAPVAEGTAPAATTGNWQVSEGTLGISVRQMGAAVAGSFATWQADITFDPEAEGPTLGAVTVTIATDSLTLGSVTAQAKDAEFFDVANHPNAVFTAEITAAEGGYLAEGTLALRGATVPVSLPFTLTIEGDTARMIGTTTVDRRDFGMGASYGDESSVGFAVEVQVELTATRVE